MQRGVGTIGPTRGERVFAWTALVIVALIVIVLSVLGLFSWALLEQFADPYGALGSELDHFRAPAGWTIVDEQKRGGAAPGLFGNVAQIERVYAAATAPPATCTATERAFRGWTPERAGGEDVPGTAAECSFLGEFEDVWASATVWSADDYSERPSGSERDDACAGQEKRGPDRGAGEMSQSAPRRTAYT